MKIFRVSQEGWISICGFSLACVARTFGFLILILVLILLIVDSIGDSNDRIIRLENSRRETENIQTERNLAVVLANRSWYVVDSITVSSLKDGQGQVIKLSEQLRTRGSHMGMIHVVKNVQARFFPAIYKNRMCGILGSLAYEYENEQAILAGKLPSVLE
jgi:hypothetical protein